MTTMAEKIGKFLAESEEETISEFMTIAGLGKEYRAADNIPKIKLVIEKFAEKGYTIGRREMFDRIGEPMVWRMALLLDGNEIVHRDIRITFNTMRKQS